MIRLFTFSVVFTTFASCVLGSDVIGFSYADGAYRINGSTVRGNATLLDATRVDVAEAAVKVQLNGGARAWLGAGSRGVVSAHGLQLLAGVGQISTVPGYVIEAGRVKVVVSAPDTLLRAMVEGDAAVISPVKGSVDVFSHRNVHVATLAAGNTVRFQDDEHAAAEVRVSGCLDARNGTYSLADRITNVRLELRGNSLDRNVGRMVEVSGLLDAGRRTETIPVVAVTRVQPLGSQSCSVVAPVQAKPVLIAGARPAAFAQGGAAGGQATPAALNLVILEGDGAINNIRQRVAREPIVQVQDENHKPVAGALVLFALPDSGPSGTFANGARTLRVTTDQQGRAVATGFQPNKLEGQLQIAVTASYAGMTATATITQTNVLGAAAAAGAAGGAAAGAAGGAAAGAAGGAAAGAAGGAAAGAAGGAAAGAAGGAAAGAAGGAAAGEAGGAAAGTAGGAAAGTAGGAAAAGVSTAVKVAVIGGVAATTGTVVGLAASGAFSSSSPESPASR